MQRIKSILGSPKVTRAMAFIEQDRALTLEQQIELAQIPAPSHMERRKAARFAEMLRDIGLGEVVVDEIDNVYLVIKGTAHRPCIMITAHSDTVFPLDTDLTVRHANDGKIYLPGICDDSRGMAELLSVARAIKATGIQPVGDIILGSNVGEEAAGDLKGVRHLFASIPDIDAFITVDTANSGTVGYNGTGSYLYSVRMRGKGGHSFVAFGMPNPAHAAGRAVAEIANLSVPCSPRTTFNVGILRGGTAPNAIPSQIEFTVDIRSNGQPELTKLDEQLQNILHQAVEQENTRWENDSKVQLELDVITRRPAATQSVDSPIVQAALEVLRLLDIPYIPKEDGASCTDANWPMHLGIPSLALGRGGEGGGGHSINEWFRPVEEHKGPQKHLLTVLALAGLKDVSDPLIHTRV